MHVDQIHRLTAPQVTWQVAGLTALTMILALFTPGLGVMALAQGTRSGTLRQGAAYATRALGRRRLPTPNQSDQEGSAVHRQFHEEQA